MHPLMDHCAFWSCFSAFCLQCQDQLLAFFSILHSFFCFCFVLFTIYSIQVSQKRWNNTGFYSLQVATFILREARCFHSNDYRCLSQLTRSSALGSMGILRNTIQIKSNALANYRIYFPFFHTHLQLNHRVLFYSPLGIERVSGKFN